MLSYNPQRERADHLAQLTCGQSRITLIEQLIRDFELEIDAELHQHHLIVGPKGSGKTHLLRVVIASHVANHARLREAFQPIVLPEELAVRTPADLLLRILECLANNLEAVAKGRGASVSNPAAECSTEQLAAARAACLEAIGAARSMQKPLDRLRRGHRGLVRASEALDRVLLPVVENLHDLFYLGASAGRRKRQETHWALRSLLQESKHIMLLSSATSLFGAVTQADAAFYDFFRTHRLEELHNDEVLQVIHRRLKDEDEHPSSDAKRRRRVRLLLEHFHERKGQLRGLLAITGGLPRYAHLIYDVIVDVNVSDVQSVLNSFLDDMTPYFAQRLDPRLLPEPEIDLLQSLASAWGPLQPSELAERLYGVLPNEVSVLLKRLEDRGLVTRKGRPDGRAITWDLTEPLYRVWTHFRTDSDEHRQFLLLAEFVARLFTMDELLGDRAHLLESCEAHPANAPVRQKLEADLRFIETAIEQQQAWRSGQATPQKAAANETETTGEIAPKEQAEGLFDALNEAKCEDNLALRDSLLDELRSLADQWPADEAVRKRFARGLFNTLNYAKLEEDLSRRDSLLDELRNLANQWPADEAVRLRLAKGLFNTLFNAKQEEDLSRRDSLLDELRALAGRWPSDENMREPLAGGLFNTLIDAKQEEDLSRRDSLLDELRNLAGQWPSDMKVREQLTWGLYNTLNYAKLEEDLSRRDSLLDELRNLANQWPADEEVREALAGGLYNTLNYAKQEEDLSRRDSLLDELRALAGQWPADEEVREALAGGLYNTLNYTKQEEDLSRRDSLLDELRALAGQWPADEEVRQQLAKGLFNTLNYAKQEEDLSRRDSLLDELRTLAAAWPLDLMVKDAMCRALQVLLPAAGSDVPVEDSEPLVAELAKQIRSWPEDGADRLIEFGVWVLRHDGAEGVKRAFGAVAGETVGGLGEQLRPVMLAAEVLEVGEERALAREPEEMRRVVRLVLEKAGHESAQAE